MRARDKRKNFIDVIYEQKSGLSAAFLDKLLLPDLQADAMQNRPLKFGLCSKTYISAQQFCVKVAKRVKSVIFDKSSRVQQTSVRIISIQCIE